MLPNQDTKSRVQPTLEDLLRLKRAERPDAAFWQDFERGMRQKQLAAIIEPRPWWLGLALLSRRIGPVGLPISAGAAAMLALVAMRVSPVGGLTQIVPASSPEPVAVAIASSPAVASPATKPAAAKVEVASVSSQVARNTAPAVSTAKPKSSAPTVERPANFSPVLAASNLPAAPEKGSVSEGKTSAPAVNRDAIAGLSVSESLAVESAAKPAPTIAATLVASVEPVEATLNAGTETFADLGSVIQPDESLDAATGLNPRQARLLASATEVAEGKSLAPVRERMLHRLVDDEARYASISRLGVNADRLSLKF